MGQTKSAHTNKGAEVDTTYTTQKKQNKTTSTSICITPNKHSHTL